MGGFDYTAVKRMEAILNVVAEADEFDTKSDELSIGELDMVTGGVAMPNFQLFLQYVRNRDAREGVLN